MHNDCAEYITEENIALYVCITFTELKSFDSLWSHKLLRTSQIKIDTALKADWEATK